MLSLQELKLAYGSKVLFEKANLNLYKNQRVGLVGQNGTGKTSLFKMLLGKISPDSGDYNLTKDITIGYVEQEIHDVDQLLVDYVLSVHPLIIGEHTDLPEYYKLQPQVEKMLKSLGFEEEELYLPLSNFSGGWQMRASLARALFTPSDMLLLDEPTNHLDVETVIWLEDWLKAYTGLAVIISHDREFLDSVATHIVAISGKQLILYTGNYSTYQNTKYMQYEQQMKQIEKSRDKIAHLQKFVDRFKAKASLAKQAQSKMKMIEKIKVSDALPRDLEFKIDFMEPEYSVDKLISIAHADFGYGDNVLISDVHFEVFQDSRIGLLGRNGVGKSTLIKGILTNKTKLNGIIDINSKIKIGYFAQNTVDGLDLNDTPLSYFIRNNPDKKENELRAYLGKYGFAGDKAHERIKVFSGGEKARLTIANIIYQKPNLLFLDEPTNHLDMNMREELASAIGQFNGGVVIVSHDKFLLQSIVDEFYLIYNHKLTKFDGDLEDYHKFLLQDNINQKARTKSSNAKKPKDNLDTTPTTLKINTKPDNITNTIKLAHDMKIIEDKIAKTNTIIIECVDKIANIDMNDNSKHKEYEICSNMYTEATTELELLENKWLQLQQKLER